MKTIGFSGGALMSKLGNADDVMCFFNCIEQFVSEGKEQKLDLLLNRLYRNYLKLDELDVAVSLMEEVQECFKSIDACKVEWSESLLNEILIDDTKKSLSDVFAQYFVAFNNVVESAHFFYEDWKIYQPVKIVVTDTPEYLNYKKLPINEYDAVKGDPLWVRDANGEKPISFRDGVAYINK